VKIIDRISYSIPESAAAVGMGMTRLREEIAAGRLIARKVGRRTIINVVDLQTWANNLTTTDMHLATAPGHRTSAPKVRPKSATKQRRRRKNGQT
jgi:hypothetical protein